MYKKIRAFVAPRDKKIFSIWNPYTRVEIVFTKRDIMIYDFINCLYLGIYNADYNIDDFDANLFLNIMDDIVKAAPKTLFHVKYYEYITDNYHSSFNKIHHYEN